ncbi:MAG TPA: response regulator [Candidatus Limnocylindria bacterium]|nr:response regulator [Candidatus Limnocylindria bacterium]
MAAEPVLLIDDQEMNLELARELLEMDGYAVRTAGDADEALAVLASGFLPRLILMDIQLPGMDGLELTRRLRADPAQAGVVIIALTAYAMVGDRERTLAAGCDGYIAKPIDTRTFSRTIREALESRR